MSDYIQIKIPNTEGHFLNQRRFAISAMDDPMTVHEEIIVAQYDENQRLQEALEEIAKTNDPLTAQAARLTEIARQALQEKTK